MSGAQRRILCSLVILGTAVPAFGQGVAWREDLKAAAREAVDSGKPMLLKFTADWCTYCHKMERTTYKDAKVADHVNRNFIPVKVDSDKNEDLTKALGIRALPTTVVVSPEMKVMRRIAGYKTADALSEQLNEVVPVGYEAKRPAAVVAAAGGAPAFGGYCLVTLREDRKLELGDPAITVTYRNKTIAFKDEKARREFEKNRAYYWPAWDGNCPVTAVETRRPVEGIPATAAIYRDRLWFFADRPHRETFDATPTKFLPSVAAGAGETSRN